MTLLKTELKTMNDDQAPVRAKNNKLKCAETMCGCYSCTQSFHGSTITQFCDNGDTALCPVCGVDAVLPNVTDPVILGTLFENWFTE